MSLQDGRDYLFLVWKDPKKKKRYIVGKLSKNGQYEFSYDCEYKEAIEAGFELLIAFQDPEKVYRNDELFSVFASRLPDPKRKDIEEILKKYQLQKYDAYELLKRSGAKLPIDNLEFIDPILVDNEETSIVRRFSIAGTGFALGCEGKQCDKSVPVSVNDILRLEPEPDNKYDLNAIKIVNSKSNDFLGYLPRYYTQSVSELLKSNAQISCKVVDFNKSGDCEECIKVELRIEKR